MSAEIVGSIRGWLTHRGSETVGLTGDKMVTMQKHGFVRRPMKPLSFFTRLLSLAPGAAENH